MKANILFLYEAYNKYNNFRLLVMKPNRHQVVGLFASEMSCIQKY